MDGLLDRPENLIRSRCGHDHAVVIVGSVHLLLYASLFNTG
jgi:hypothetical protein